MSEALDSQLKFTESGGQGWWIASGTDDEYYYEADAAQSDYDLPDSGGETCLQAIVDSANSETVKFYWKVSSEQNHDYLQFYIDGTLKDQISGEVAWQQKSYAVTSGIHILKWRYVKDGSGQSGSDCGWVDFVQWTGPSPAQDPANWQEIAYKQDVKGRRVEKKVDGYSTRYCYDMGGVIAEYDGNNNLLRKYIYGPGVDKPVCMIEVADANATYYYHFDGLGSVVALSDSAGDTVQTYEYSVYGEVAVEDANHPNPYMFAGVRYDIEIGLYYNRERYYNPFMGRFLQTDPVGYEDGMNIYAYCNNNPLVFVDPSGTSFDPANLVIPGGYWANKLKKPAYPGNWTSWVDFFAWYAHGEGKTVDLRDVGLLDDLRANEEVEGWEKGLREHWDDMAKELAKMILRTGRDKAQHSEKASKDVDFGDNVKWDVVAGLFAPSCSDPLVVLGNCTIKAEITIKAERDPVQADKAWWSRTIEYSLNDSFKDPGDIYDQYLGELEWMDCTPYSIRASWSSVNGGYVIGGTAP